MIWESQYTAISPDEVSKNPINRGGGKGHTGKVVYDIFFLMLNFSQSIVCKQIPRGR